MLLGCGCNSAVLGKIAEGGATKIYVRMTELRRVPILRMNNAAVEDILRVFVLIGLMVFRTTFR